jgi:hypothetical protein
VGKKKSIIERLQLRYEAVTASRVLYTERHFEMHHHESAKSCVNRPKKSLQFRRVDLSGAIIANAAARDCRSPTTPPDTSRRRFSCAFWIAGPSSAGSGFKGVTPFCCADNIRLSGLSTIPTISLLLPRMFYG